MCDSMYCCCWRQKSGCNSTNRQSRLRHAWCVPSSQLYPAADSQRGINRTGCKMSTATNQTYAATAQVVHQGCTSLTVAAPAALPQTDSMMPSWSCTHTRTMRGPSPHRKNTLCIKPYLHGRYVRGLGESASLPAAARQHVISCSQQQAPTHQAYPKPNRNSSFRPPHELSSATGRRIRLVTESAAPITPKCCARDVCTWAATKDTLTQSAGYMGTKCTHWGGA